MILKLFKSPRFSKAARKVVTFILFASTLFSLIPAFTMEAAAYETKYGTVNISDSHLNVRSGPGTSYDKVGQLTKGADVTIVDEETSSDGKLWYKIEFVSDSGEFAYVLASYIKLNYTYTPDEDFEAWLDLQGFPESYKAGLRQLHAQYPNWIFEAMHVEYDWDYSIAEEYVLGKNLVENSFPSSWKSTQDGAYDWETSTWKGLDGSRWVAASKEIIEYYMDPRNFLDSDNVFLFLDQTFNENLHNVEGVQALLDRTFMAGELPDSPGKTYAQCIFEASKQHDANPYIIASMLITEQGTSGSALSSGTYPGYEGYYNFFNIGAAASGGNSAIVNGLKTARENGWNTREKAISAGIEIYANQYIKAGQITLYLKKFNVQGSSAFYHQYMTSVYAAKVEGEITADGYSEEDRQKPLVFIIPVYSNMPETPCAKPTGDGSPNIKLSSIKVDGYSLTPAFQPDILEYGLVVSEDTTSVNISAVTMDSKASVTGTGTISLTDTETVVSLTVTAENGNTRTYTITIAKESEGLAGVEFSDKYTLSGTYILASPGTVSETMTSELLVSGTAIITLSDGSSKDSSAVLKTGDKVIVYDEAGESQGIYVVCVRGDINGDGAVSHNDFTMLRNHLIRVQTLEGISAAAADINGDGNINNNDFTLMRNHIINVVPIS